MNFFDGILVGLAAGLLLGLAFACGMRVMVDNELSSEENDNA